MCSHREPLYRRTNAGESGLSSYLALMSYSMNLMDSAFISTPFLSFASYLARVSRHFGR